MYLCPLSSHICLKDFINFFFLFFFFFFLHYVICKISVPPPGIEPRPHQWKPEVLTTRPPENSWDSMKEKSESVSRSVMSDSLQPHGQWPARLLCPWNSPGKNTGVGCHALLQGIVSAQGSNPARLHCRQILYCLSHEERPWDSLTLTERCLYFYISSHLTFPYETSDFLGRRRPLTSISTQCL